MMVAMERTNDSRYVDMVFKRLCDHPVLQDQNLFEKPMYWFMVLYGRLVSQRTELALRCDNLYLNGFSNAAGEWFSFKDAEYVIPGSTQLNFKANYASLMGNGDEEDDAPRGGEAWKKLIGLELGLRYILDAIEVLADCHRKETPESVLKLAIVRIVVVFIEAQRFPHIRELVRQAWSNPNGGKLDEFGAHLIVNWKDISCALLIWDGSADKNSWHKISEAKKMKRKLGITTAEEALAAVWPILQSNDCSH
nr:unnamed protein product [Digitaria exilis]